MNQYKYVEIHCKKITFKKEIPSELKIEIVSHFPTISFPNNKTTRWLENFTFTPNTILLKQDNLVFANYVGNFLQIDFLLHKISQKNSKAKISFSNNLEIHLFKTTTINIFNNNKNIGQIEVEIYIQPFFSRRGFFHYPVIVFPISQKEIAIYYNGDLSKSKQVYCIATTDDWNSNTLKKMNKWGSIWISTIKKTKLMQQLELAFTDNKDTWDNKNGRNWHFSHCKWSHLN